MTMPTGQEATARAFFIGIFDMEELSKPAHLKDRGGCWLKNGPMNLHIGTEHPFIPQKKAHPAFIVNDILEIERRLREQGFPIKWDQTFTDRQRFYTEDPFGNRIEILRDGDGFSQK